MISGAELDELVFQVLLGRMQGKKRFQRPILEETVIQLCKDVKTVFDREPVMLKLAANIVVVGDLHGHIDDLLRIFERMRYPPAMRYVFLGDYVDRGIYGTEVLLLLFALKIKFPEHIYMLRGNHETQNLSRYYGFFKEVTSKYSQAVYNQIIDTFTSLPLCAVIGERVFCVHGGISPELDLLEQLDGMEKPVDFMQPGIFSDMVWSDPCADIDEFEPSDRGCGYIYGAAALSDFLDDNNLDLLIRSHEMCTDGVSWPYADDEENVDRCLTIFSNSDYCGRGNTAAILHIAADLLGNVEVFAPVSQDHGKKRHVLLPYWLYDMIAKKEDPKKAVKAAAVLRADENDASNENIAVA